MRDFLFSSATTTDLLEQNVDYDKCWVSDVTEYKPQNMIECWVSNRLKVVFIKECSKNVYIFLMKVAKIKVAEKEIDIRINGTYIF